MTERNESDRALAPAGEAEGFVPGSDWLAAEALFAGPRVDPVESPHAPVVRFKRRRLPLAGAPGPEDRQPTEAELQERAVRTFRLPDAPRAPCPPQEPVALQEPTEASLAPVRHRRVKRDPLRRPGAVTLIRFETAEAPPSVPLAVLADAPGEFGLAEPSRFVEILGAIDALRRTVAEAERARAFRIL